MNSTIIRKERNHIKFRSQFPHTKFEKSFTTNLIAENSNIIIFYDKLCCVLSFAPLLFFEAIYSFHYFD